MFGVAGYFVVALAHVVAAVADSAGLAVEAVELAEFVGAADLVCAAEELVDLVGAAAEGLNAVQDSIAAMASQRLGESENPAEAGE